MGETSASADMESHPTLWIHASVTSATAQAATPQQAQNLTPLLQHRIQPLSPKNMENKRSTTCFSFLTEQDPSRTFRVSTLTHLTPNKCNFSFLGDGKTFVSHATFKSLGAAPGLLLSRIHPRYGMSFL